MQSSSRVPAWSPWRTVVTFGVVSLAADMVYEGARAVTGPYLVALGASAALVGLVTGLGEAAALGLRLVFGPLADRGTSYWPLTVLGYAMTAVAVPLLALAPLLGGAGLTVGATLVVVERTGKAVRSPAKSALLAAAARSVGRGRGFAVHKALDQVGALAGPLVVAGIAYASGSTAVALGALAVPGAVAMALLLLTRRRVPDPAAYDETVTVRATTADLRTRLPRRFHLVALSCALSTAGLMTFGVLSVHLVASDLVPVALVPVVYAGAMAVEAVGALATGAAYDTHGARVLLVVPPLVVLVPALSFAGSLGLVLVGLAVWGVATGVQDSTVKALVADVVPAGRLGTAYGVFAAWQGVAALVGGVTAGALYDADRVGVLVALVAVAQLAALVLLARVTRQDHTAHPGPVGAAR